MWQEDCGALEALCGARRSAVRGGAFSYTGRSISRRRLYRQKEDCARALVRWGVSAGDPVLLCAASTPEGIASLLALWKLGAVPYLLDPDRPLGELQKAVRRSGARILLVTDRFLSRMESVPEEGFILQVVVIPLGGSMYRSTRRRLPKTPSSGREALPWKDFLASGRMIPVALGEALFDSDLAAVAWKGPEYDEEARVSHGDLAAMTRAWEMLLSAGRGDFFGMLSPWDLSGLAPLLAALRLGVLVILEPEPSPDELVGTLLREQPSRVLVTSALWQWLWNHSRMDEAELSFLEKIWLAVSPENEAVDGGTPLDVFFPCSVEIIIV